MGSISRKQRRSYNQNELTIELIEQVFIQQCQIARNDN